MDVKMYLPNAKFVVGTLIVLVAVTFALRSLPANNTLVAKLKYWFGYTAA